MNKIALTTVTLVALISLTLSGCGLLLNVPLSGGVGNVIKDHKPVPDVSGPAITRQRETAKAEIDATLAEVDAGARFTSYATATDDRCDKGENNAFTRDGYAYRCTARVTRFYGTSGNFRERMLGFEDLLASSGWQLPRDTFREMFAKYYDVYCAYPGNVYRGSQRIAVFGARPGAAPQCEISKLPRSASDGYKKGGLTLWIEYGERGADTLRTRDTMDLMQRVPVTLFKEGDPKYDLYKNQNLLSLQNLNALIEDITASHPYVLSVTLQKTYFEN